MTELLRRLRRAHRSSVALVLFAILALQPLLALASSRPVAAAGAGACIMVAVAWHRSPVAVAVFIIGASIVMRLGFIGVGYADQIQVSQSAFERVLAEGNPYGVGYASTMPPGSPFPYGPLGLIWWLPGPIVEGFAAVALMVLLAWRGAWLTLAFIGGWVVAIAMTFHGGNDYGPALLILAAVILLPTHPRWAGATLAAAIALKPYAAAWLLPFIGAGAGLTAVAGTLVLWSPLLLVWGIPSFLKTVDLAAHLHAQGPPDQTLNVPALRWLAVPFALIGLAARRWEDAALLGSATFIIFLFLDRWASTGYWMAVIPPLGMALESLWRKRAQAPESERVERNRSVRSRRHRLDLVPGLSVASDFLRPREQQVAARPHPVEAEEALRR